MLPDRPQDPRHLRPLQHHQRTGNCSRPGTSWSPIWRNTHRRRRVAGGPTPPVWAPQVASRPQVRASPRSWHPRRRGGPTRPTTGTHAGTRQPAPATTRHLQDARTPTCSGVSASAGCSVSTRVVGPLIAPYGAASVSWRRLWKTSRPAGNSSIRPPWQVDPAGGTHVGSEDACPAAGIQFYARVAPSSYP